MSGLSWDISWEVSSALFLVILSRVFFISSIFVLFVVVVLSVFEILASNSLILGLVSFSDLSDCRVNSSLDDSRVLSLLSMLIIFSSDSLNVLMAVLAVVWASLAVLRALVALSWASSAFLLTSLRVLLMPEIF